MRASLFILALIVAAPSFAADTKPAQPGADKDKLICKREVPIGSLIATRKTCLTKRGWAQLREDSELSYDRMNPHLASVPGN